MPRRKKIEPFFIVVKDHDKKVFNVLGPMEDDTLITNQVCDCQNQGRQVNCSTAGRGQSRDEIIKSVSAKRIFKYTDIPIVP